MSTASFEVVLNVTEPERLKAFALTLNPDLEDDMSVEDALEEALSNARVAPLESGYEIQNKTAFHDFADTYRMQVVASVFDPAALMAAVKESYRLSWDDTFEPENLGEALYEQVLASNASPAPLEIGFEIMDRMFKGAAVPATTPAP